MTDSSCNLAPTISGTSRWWAICCRCCALRHRRGWSPSSSLAAGQRNIDFDDANAQRGYKPMRSYGIAKLAQLMFAVEFDRRSRAAGWGVMSNAAHPGLSKTNLLSGASYAAGRPTLQARLARLSWRFLPFIWLDVDEGIKPTLYAAVSPDAKGGAYYGPRGFLRNRRRWSHFRPHAATCRAVTSTTIGCGGSPNSSPASAIQTE